MNLVVAENVERIKAFFLKGNEPSEATSYLEIGATESTYVSELEGEIDDLELVEWALRDIQSPPNLASLGFNALGQAMLPGLHSLDQRYDQLAAQNRVLVLTAQLRGRVYGAAIARKENIVPQMNSMFADYLDKMMQTAEEIAGFGIDQVMSYLAQGEAGHPRIAERGVQVRADRLADRVRKRVASAPPRIGQGRTSTEHYENSVYSRIQSLNATPPTILDHLMLTTTGSLPFDPHEINFFS